MAFCHLQITLPQDLFPSLHITVYPRLTTCLRPPEAVPYFHPLYLLPRFLKTADQPVLEPVSPPPQYMEILTLLPSLLLVDLVTVVDGVLGSGRQIHRVPVAVVEQVLEHMDCM